MVVGISRPIARYLANLANGRSIFPGSLSGWFAATPHGTYHALRATSTLRVGGGPIAEGRDRPVDVFFCVRERHERRLELRRRPIEAPRQHAVEKAREALAVGAARFFRIAHARDAEKERQHRSLPIDDARDAPGLESGFEPALKPDARR